MRFLGIDYGSKRIGTALSDEGGTLAFPKKVIPNGENIFPELDAIIKKENVSEIVVGESIDFSGKPNAIAEEIETFIFRLQSKFGLPVHNQKEFLTSVEARRYQGGGQVDASAAALILQRYLDRRNKQGLRKA